MLSFTDYMLNEAAFTKLTPKEWLKYDWRIDILLRKYKEGDAFTLFDGTQVKFAFDQETYNAIETRDKQALSAVRLQGEDGKEYRLSQIGKTPEFGGKGEGAGTSKEDIQLQRLNDQLNDIKAEIASPTVPMKIGRTTYDVFEARTTPGTPKSDFHLVDIDGNEIVWISHKDGKSAKDFQQWGGISKRSEPKIFNHPEVQKFVEDLKAEYPDGLPRATSLYRKIKDDKLKNMAVYGNEYGRKPSRQNVTVTIQGPVDIKKTGNLYEFKSNHIHMNGDKMRGEFEPVLAAIYKGDRSDAGVKGTRIVIMPIAGRKFKGTI